LADQYEVHLTVDLGPFAVEDPGPIVIRKSQLLPAKVTAVEECGNTAIIVLCTGLLTLLAVWLTLRGRQLRKRAEKPESNQ
jgi:hypothetical protein